ncbi:11659_t:CDS:2 [Funneliformis geosporum]|uniref:11659_t:CDS:1 n=1 Tax=Funneliformis geosporum TaxID=1117311 RepID=A0A9W4SVK8_9GLOM|nr:11659_t:CDS:2 [Funneliformis geosporum]
MNQSVLGQVRKPHHTITDQEIIETLERLKKAGGGESGPTIEEVLNEAELKSQIIERENLIKKLNTRPPNQMLSPTDQTKLNQAQAELLLLKKRQNVATTHSFHPADIDYPSQLRMLNEKHDQLNDKLN